MMKLPYILALSTATIGGCLQSSPPPPQEPGRVVTSLREIAGSWDIESFEGYRPMRLHEGIRRAFVEISSEHLSYAIECNYSGNPASIDSTGILHDRGDGGRVQTLAGCGDKEAREGAFFFFFSRQPKVTWIERGRIRMSSGGVELILERPEARRLAHVPAAQELTGRWIPQSATQLVGTGGHSGWGFQQPGAVTIDAGELHYPDCRATFRFRYSADGRMETESEQAPPNCSTNSPGSMLLRVMHGRPLVERIAGGGIALSSGKEVITLRSEQELRRLLANPPPPPPPAHQIPPPPPSPPSAR